MNPVFQPRQLPDEAATLAFGAELAALGLRSELVFLHGDLGAGKTTLVRGFLRALGHVGAVKSPTYTLLETYDLDAAGVEDAVEVEVEDPRGFLRALGHVGAVKSPTYTLLETYDLDAARVLHFDFYRIFDPRELGYMGIDDLLAEPAVKLVEWPSKAGDKLPAADIEVRLHVEGEARRVAAVDHRAEAAQTGSAS